MKNEVEQSGKSAKAAVLVAGLILVASTVIGGASTSTWSDETGLLKTPRTVTADFAVSMGDSGFQQTNRVSDVIRLDAPSGSEVSLVNNPFTVAIPAVVKMRVGEGFTGSYEVTVRDSAGVWDDAGTTVNVYSITAPSSCTTTAAGDALYSGPAKTLRVDVDGISGEGTQTQQLCFVAVAPTTTYTVDHSVTVDSTNVLGQTRANDSISSPYLGSAYDSGSINFDVSWAVAR